MGSHASGALSMQAQPEFPEFLDSKGDWVEMRKRRGHQTMERPPEEPHYSRFTSGINALLPHPWVASPKRRSDSDAPRYQGTSRLPHVESRTPNSCGDALDPCPESWHALPRSYPEEEVVAATCSAQKLARTPS